MAIITISRGSYSKGKEVAERVAARLGYDCISREVLLEASKRFNIPEMQLTRAIHDAPSILDRFQHSKQAYIAYIRSALTQQVKKDNIVYHGLAGHLLLKGVPHVLKVRITARLEDRIAAEMSRESIAEHEARSRYCSKMTRNVAGGPKAFTMQILGIVRCMIWLSASISSV